MLDIKHLIVWSNNAGCCWMKFTNFIPCHKKLESPKSVDLDDFVNASRYFNL